MYLHVNVLIIALPAIVHSGLKQLQNQVARGPTHLYKQTFTCRFTHMRTQTHTQTDDLYWRGCLIYFVMAKHYLTILEENIWWAILHMESCQKITKTKHTLFGTLTKWRTLCEYLIMGLQSPGSWKVQNPVFRAKEKIHSAKFPGF